MICSVSHSSIATIWKFLTQYPYEPVNNICVFQPIGIAHFQDVNATPHTLTGIGPEAWGVFHSISKVSNVNGPKHTYIVDRFIGVLCKEFQDCSCETMTYITNHGFQTKVSCELRLF